MQNIRWKIITITVVLVVFTAVGVYPLLASWKNLPQPGWLKEKQLKLGLDLKGGVHLVLRVQTDDALRLETETEMERLRAEVQTRKTIERRVNELGVTEPSIAQQGAGGDQILVQLPGVTDVNRAKEIMGSPGLLELKIVEQGPASTKEALM